MDDLPLPIDLVSLVNRYPKSFKILMHFQPDPQEFPCLLPNTVVHPVEVPNCLVQVVAFLLHVCVRSEGFGQCKLKFDRTRKDRPRLLFKAGASYSRYINPIDLEMLNDWFREVLAAIR